MRQGDRGAPSDARADELKGESTGAVLAISSLLGVDRNLHDSTCRQVADSWRLFVDHDVKKASCQLVERV